MRDAKCEMRKVKYAFALVGVLALPALATAQDIRRDIRDSQLRLDQIRQERLKLQQEMDALRGRVRDASRELANIERQRIASSGALRELEFQADVLSDNVEETTTQRSQTQARLVQRQVALEQRLRSIYKRGPMHTVRVLLTAEDFGNLISRYKYLRMIALYERMMVDEVSRLENALMLQEQELRDNLMSLEVLKSQKEQEVQQLETIESQRERTLKTYQSRQKVAQGRLDQLARDEAAVTSAIGALERRRREEETRSGGRPAEATLTTRDLGALNWPVDGQVVFKFGPDRRPNGVVLRYNGIGIGAPAGTPVKAVEAGTVQLAGTLEGYGRSVVVSHGAGAYTLYLRLRQVGVRVGQKVTAGQVLGQVGGEGTEQGPHLEFQVRVPTNGTPTAVDPENWLRSRR